MTDDRSPPLTDITVLALEHAIAAPLCTRQLAELGARVIKVERRGTGDFARAYDSRVRGLSSHFVWVNRGKESLTLDLKHEGAQEILERLLPEVDVLVQNLAPAAASRLGLGYDELNEQYPRLIVCNISGYGDRGPYADKKAYDLLVQAEAGFLSVTGLPDALVKSGISIADIAAGSQAHTAILAALIKRGQNGRGSRIDISLLEAMVEWMGFPLLYAYDGAEPPPRSGADHASIYPYGVFRSGDDQALVIGLQNEREWQAFCAEVLDQPALSSDARFTDNTARSAQREVLGEIIQNHLGTLSAEELTASLDAAGIAWARVNDMAAVWRHPQLQALDRLSQIGTPAGPVQSFRPPGNNSHFDFALGDVPALGEHSEPLLQELGFDAHQIADFTRRNLI